MQDTITEIKVGTVLTAVESREILKFRSHMFEEAYQLGSERPDEFGNKTPDNFDKQSVHFVIREDESGTIVAYARMIFAPITQLPIFNYYPPSNSQVIAVEISRFCVRKSNRSNYSALGSGYRLLIEMMKFSLAIGMNSWYCTFQTGFYHAARRLFKISLQSLGPERRFSKTTYVQPALLDVVETVAKNQHRIYTQYMVSELEGPSKFDRRRLQAFGRLVAQKLAA